MPESRKVPERPLPNIRWPESQSEAKENPKKFIFSLASNTLGLLVVAIIVTLMLITLASGIGLAYRLFMLAAGF